MMFQGGYVPLWRIYQSMIGNSAQCEPQEIPYELLEEHSTEIPYWTHR